MVRCLKFLLPLCFIGIATAQSVHAGPVAVNAVQESFARAWGLVRYFSPNPYTQEWNEDEWFTVCLYLFERLPEDGDPQRMLELLRPLAPNASISASPDDERRSIVGDKADYRYRQHHGGGKVVIPGIARMLYKEYRHYEPFYSELVVCDDTPNTPQAGTAYAYEVFEGLYLHLPVAEREDVFSEKETKALLRAATKEWKKMLKSYGEDMVSRTIGLFNNESYRVTDILTRWNHVQHFYPYLTEDAPDWDSHLPVMLDRMRNMAPVLRDNLLKDLLQYRTTVLELMNPIHDSHLSVGWSLSLTPPVGRYITYSYLPLQLDLVENTVLIAAVSPDATTAITPGSILEAVNGCDAFALLEEQLSHVNSSNRRAALYKALPDIISSPDADAEITLRYRTPDGEPAEATMITSVTRPYFDRATVEGPFMRFTEDNIAIVDPRQRSATYEEFAAHLDSIRNARGVVFDLRGYPMYDFDKVLAHLTDVPLSTSFISTPVYRFPCQMHVTYSKNDERIEPIAPKIDAPVVFLCDSDAVSWAETVLMLADGYGLGTIVGTPSCGTNGDVTDYMLRVFNYKMTANHAVNVDGSRNHGIGVIPDIEATETLDGYLAGRDEVLEAGLEYVRGNLK